MNSAERLKPLVKFGWDPKLTLDFVEDLITELRKEGYNDEIHIVAPHRHKMVLDRPEGKPILIAFLDEFDQIYKYPHLDDYRFVITTLGMYSTDNIIPIPLGYSKRAVVKDIPKLSTYSFFGWSTRREEFLKQVETIPEGLRDILSFGKWGGGLSPQEYLDRLSCSRYALNPLGSLTACYRFYEALMVGSIPVSETDPWSYLPEPPFVRVKDYTYDSILKGLDEYYKKFTDESPKQYFENYLSIPALVRRINEFRY